MNELTTWLREATRCLAAESAARVEGEIREHYECAIETAVGSGASEAEARREALAALGDARKANREYRRVLLTAGEAKALREGQREARMVCRHGWVKRLMVWAPILLAGAAIPLLMAGWRTAAWNALAGGIGMGVVLAGPFLPVYTMRRGRVYRAVKWVAVAGAMVALFGGKTLEMSWLVCSCLYPMLYLEWTRAAIRRKLPVAEWPKHLYL